MIVVGDPNPTLIRWAGRDLYTVPPVLPSGDRIEDRWKAIRRAMTLAVKLADFGEPVFQNDMQLFADPTVAAPTPGSVRVLSEPIDHSHVCPRGFIIYDQETKDAVVDAFVFGKGRACMAWRPVPKATDYVCAFHPDKHDEG